MLRINNIKIRKDISDEEIFELAIKEKYIEKSDIIEWHISKKSIDARKKNDIHYSYSIDLEVKNEKKYKKLEKVKKFEMPTFKIKNKFDKKTVIVGAGPAGLFAAIILIQNGIKPIIIEQGRLCRRKKRGNRKFSKKGLS